MNADGTNATQLMRGDSAASDAAWSPDGSRIAFTRCRGSCDIYVMNADGSAQTNLHVIGDAYSRPSWSPDGTRLAYSWLTACIVPKLAGMKLQAARSRIRRASCSPGRVRFTASARPRGTVLHQQPQARAERRIGAKVSLIVSSGH